VQGVYAKLIAPAMVAVQIALLLQVQRAKGLRRLRESPRHGAQSAIARRGALTAHLDDAILARHQEFEF
jgi:hypothetical protein